MTSASDLAFGAAPCVDGKFLHVGGRRFLVRGVAYGTFTPDVKGGQFPPHVRIAQDFAAMAAAGINTIRTYTVPPPELLDAALQHGLRVLVGIPWPQHVAFLADRHLVRRIRRDAENAVRRLAVHPATLMFAVGNEIPAGIIRWHGHRRVERFLRELHDQVKAASPSSLFTYVNFPPTEYLDLDHFDVCAFNVYLHRESDLRAYLARLQHIAGARPLLLAEAGADSLREGLEGQARITAAQVRAAFHEGACGAIVYAWTDEWWRGGRIVDDWAFGLVDEARQAKPALAAVSDAFAHAPVLGREAARWPKVSVVVCAFNAADTIGDCLRSLDGLTYPNFELIVVDDGSRDDTAAIARRHPNVRLIEAPHGGLSSARNVGLSAAGGEIVAYTDADVRVDPDWLTYLVQPLVGSDLVGAGGPNVVPPDDPWLAQCVARAPGGPSHVMLDDRIAEHVPGCNMAFRRDALLSINGFNPVYRRAGDDVDICWRLQARGFRIGYAPAALVWHHHRQSIKAFLRQQAGYGEGEAWLGEHHPDKFLGGRTLWHGRIYSPLPSLRSMFGKRVNTGVWGTASFPSVYTTAVMRWQLVPHTPLWIVASLLLIAAGMLGSVRGIGGWWAFLAAGMIGSTITSARCAIFAWRSDLSRLPPIAPWSLLQSRMVYRVVIAWLHFLQPMARFLGHLRGWSRSQGVAPQHVTRHPWNVPPLAVGDAPAALRLFRGRSREWSFWSESWTSHSAVLTELVGVLRACRATPLVHVDEGWHADRDLSVSIGTWGWLHVLTVAEEHESGCCLLRIKARLRPSFTGTLNALALAILLVSAIVLSTALYRPSAGFMASLLAVAALVVRALWQAARGARALDHAVQRVTSAAGLVPLPLAPASTPSPHPAGSAETTLTGG